MHPAESLRRRLQKRLAVLKNERNTWVEHWRELSENILPRRGRFASNERNKGTKRNDKIINSTPPRAVRTLSSGLHAGITSPARPWFRLSTVDPNVAEQGAVRQWLHVVEERIRQVFARSNIYNALPMLYADLCVFGTSPAIIEPDQEDIIRAYVLPVGTYCLTSDERGRINGCFRETGMTVEQLVRKFGRENCSQKVRENYDLGNLDTWVDVVHYIGPNEYRDESKADYRGKKWMSCWWEVGRGDDPDAFLRRSGYARLPLIAPRWDVTGEDVYGHSPAMTALGDIKALYFVEKKSAQVFDKVVNPPMRGPSSLRSTRVSLLPGDITYVDAMSGGATLEPAMQVNPQAAGLAEEKIRRLEEKIDSVFMTDMWLMMANTDRRQITAREVDERHEEKMLQLGPVLERLHDELLQPLIDIAFDALVERGLLPPPPPEIQGHDLRVEYISVAAQAQKLTGTVGIERLMSFTGNLAAVKQDILDKVDFDEVIDRYADLLGTPPDLVRNDEHVQEIRDSRLQAQQQAAMAQQMQMAAQGAKTLSETDTGSDNALTRILGVAGAAA